MPRGRLDLNLRKDHLNAVITNGVVARIHRFSERERLDEIVEFVIPASARSALSVELEPGRYVVQAILPSGRILRKDAVVDAGRTVVVEFSAGASPHEWLSWQRFEDLVPSADATDNRTTARPLPNRERSFRSRILRESLNPAIDTPSLYRFSSPNEAQSALHWADLARVYSATGLAPQLWNVDGSWLPKLATESAYSDGRFTVWRLSDAPNGLRTREWLLLTTRRGAELASLPLPWQDVFTGQSADAEVLVDSEALAGRAALSLLVRDETLGGLMAYLGRGRIGVGKVLLDSLAADGLIEHAIFNKFLNPLAACAAAYVGLALLKPEESERWDPWLSNLMERFPWLPDGAILHARRIMLRPRYREERHQALAAAKCAFRRGIPFFSAGVQYLRDILFLFADKDEEVKTMLEQVSSVARRIDLDQAFTVIHFPMGEA